MNKKSMLIAAAVLLAWGTAAPAGTISFSGYQWNVRSGSGGPGPNNWSDQNVYVDSSNNLHLKLTYDNGQWNAAELVSQQSFGFGTYQFQLQGLPTLDPYDVFGMFNYGGQDYTNEIDIEMSTFGGNTGPGNWTVWPAVSGGPGGDTTQTFNPASGPSTQRFTWSSTQVAFQALDANNVPYASWTDTPRDPSQSIPQVPMPIHMNLWRFQGNQTPGQSVEVVVSSFKFTPLTPVPLPGSGPLALAGFGFLGLLGRRRRQPRQGQTSS